MVQVNGGTVTVNSSVGIGGSGRNSLIVSNGSQMSSGAGGFFVGCNGGMSNSLTVVGGPNGGAIFDAGGTNAGAGGAVILDTFLLV